MLLVIAKDPQYDVYEYLEMSQNISRYKPLLRPRINYRDQMEVRMTYRVTNIIGVVCFPKKI